MAHGYRPFSASRSWPLPSAVGALVALAASPALAAGYAAPPDSPYERVVEPEPAPPERPYAPLERPPSTFRFHVGPALLVQPGSPGLATALDIGRRAVGARLSGAWLRAGSERGLSAYSAELWIDLRPGTELHPILGAGASWLHGGALRTSSESGSPRPSVGAAVLRAALEYELPLADADARLSLNALGLVPAIESERSRPWVVTTLMIGAGF